MCHCPPVALAGAATSPMEFRGFLYCHETGESMLAGLARLALEPGLLDFVWTQLPCWEAKGMLVVNANLGNKLVLSESCVEVKGPSLLEICPLACLHCWATILRAISH